MGTATFNHHDQNSNRFAESDFPEIVSHTAPFAYAQSAKKAASLPSVSRLSVVVFPVRSLQKPRVLGSRSRI